MPTAPLIWTGWLPSSTSDLPCHQGPAQWQCAVSDCGYCPRTWCCPWPVDRLHTLITDLLHHHKLVCRSDSWLKQAPIPGADLLTWLGYRRWPWLTRFLPPWPFIALGSWSIIFQGVTVPCHSLTLRFFIRCSGGETEIVWEKYGVLAHRFTGDWVLTSFCKQKLMESVINGSFPEEKRLPGDRTGKLNSSHPTEWRTVVRAKWAGMWRLDHISSMQSHQNASQSKNKTQTPKLHWKL